MQHTVAFTLEGLCVAVSLTDDLSKAGLPSVMATIARYIKALLDAKIFYECPRFDMKSKKSLSGEKKYYLSDTGFYYIQNTDNRINFDPVLENITYIRKIPRLLCKRRKDW